MNRNTRKTLNINPITAVGVIAILFCIFSNVNSYSKYGRGCMDIGCLPNEVCVMSHDSCNFGQRDGKECGSFPTCQKNGNGGPSGNGGVKPSDATSSHSSSPVQNSNVPSNGGGSNTNSGGYNGFSAGGHNLYPSLPNNNPSPQSNYNGGGAGQGQGGYQPPYNNPYGGYNPGMGNGGNNGGYNGGAGGYYGGGGQPGGYYGGGGNGGYNSNHGGGGYQPAPQPGKKDEGNGFFTNLLNQAASQYINGQIQKVLGGGGQQPQQPSGGYGSGGYGSGGSNSGGAGGFLNSFLGNVLNGGGGNQPPRQSSGSGGLGFLGDILNSRGGGSGGGGGSAISEILGSRNFGGLFSEKSPSGSSNSAPVSNGPKSYPTQAPATYNY